jgi:arginyl-tRNA synthetase
MLKDITKYLEQIFKELDLDNYLKISSSDKADYQINSVFMIAKDKHVNPKEIGEMIESKINEQPDVKDYFRKVEFVMPGFINLFVSDKLINKHINSYITNGFVEKTDSKDVYFLDYGGPNVAKPLHIGHLRPAIIGESIKRILNLKGYKTIGDVHLGDYGLQIGEVIYGLKKENIPLSELNIDLLNRIYPEMSALAKSDEEVYNECKKITSELQKGNIEYKEYFKKIKEVSVDDIKRLYNYLGVSFDLWLGESDSEPYIPKLMNELESRNLIVVDQGAKIVNVKQDTDKKEMPPVIVEKSDGSAIYATTDLATIMERVEKYDPKYILYVVDARQSLHFEGVFRIAKMLGYDTNLEHIPFGTINGSDGKPFKTRSGETLKLDELIKNTKEIFLNKREENKSMSEEDLDKIVNAIIKYADLQNNREKSYNFDISKFSDVSGKTGPYILYSALRIRKIINSFNYNKGNVSEVIYNDIDRSLRLKLLDFNKYLDKSIEDRLPSIIGEYVYDLANLLNSFYQNINISKITDENMKNDYLNVLDLSFNILKECLDLLIIELPSEM